jgi:glycosyltransferase involved in cell wall biosynthesis
MQIHCVIEAGAGAGDPVTTASVLAGVCSPFLVLSPEQSRHWAAGPQDRGADALSPVGAFLAAAAEAEAAVLFLLAGAAIPAEAVRELARVCADDPHYGFIFPRLTEPGTPDRIAALHSASGDPELPLLPATILPHLPARYLTTQYSSPCLLVRPEVVRNFLPLDRNLPLLHVALFELVHRARRIGFRCVIANRALATAPQPFGLEPPAPGSPPYKAWAQRLADGERAALGFFEAPEHDREAVLGRVLHPEPAVRENLLLEATGVTANLDGTTESILHILDGIHGLDGIHELVSERRVTVIATPQAEAFHGLAKRYPRFAWVEPDCRRRFAVALRLSQPWTFEHLLTLHRLAPVTLALMHDTIAWDVVYPSLNRLDEVWQFLPVLLDGVLYNSAYTGERYRRRLPATPPQAERVVRFPLDPAAYRPEPRPEKIADPDPGSGHVFVVGNPFDHKWLHPTLERLTAAFPERRFRCLGTSKMSAPNLEVLPSGCWPQWRIDALYARAAAVVFPSFYEGFGFPVVKGLAGGGTVLARRSALLEELAAHYRGPGRLLDYGNDDQLVRSLEQVLAGTPPAGLALGTALAAGASPGSWREVAQGILEFAQGLTGTVPGPRWNERDRLVRAMRAYHQSLVPKA